MKKSVKRLLLSRETIRNASLGLVRGATDQTLPPAPSDGIAADTVCYTMGGNGAYNNLTSDCTNTNCKVSCAGCG